MHETHDDCNVVTNVAKIVGVAVAMAAVTAIGTYVFDLLRTLE